MKGISEFHEQQALVRYASVAYPDLEFCASAGGLHTSKTQAGKMKAAGYRKGFPDVQFCEARGGYFGLFIEMKAMKGRATPEQKEWIARLNEKGYRAEFAHGFEAAKAILDHYMKLTPTNKSL